MYRILKFVVSSLRQDSFRMEGGTVRGMGVTLAVIIEGPSIIELWCGGGGGPTSFLHHYVHPII
jgi:hypothetical protein